MYSWADVSRETDSLCNSRPLTRCFDCHICLPMMRQKERGEIFTTLCNWWSSLSSPMDGMELGSSVKRLLSISRCTMHPHFPPRVSCDVWMQSLLMPSTATGIEQKNTHTQQKEKDRKRNVTSRGDCMRLHETWRRTTAQGRFLFPSLIPSPLFAVRLRNMCIHTSQVPVMWPFVTKLLFFFSLEFCFLLTVVFSSGWRNNCLLFYLKKGKIICLG